MAIRPLRDRPVRRRSLRHVPTLLLIHGFRGDHHGMQLIVDALPEYEVLVPICQASAKPLR